MGLLALKLLMSMQRQKQKHLQAPPNRSIIASGAKRRPKRKRSACQHDDSRGYKRVSYSGPDLPEDIWCHILSLLPMRDAARVACVSQAFLHSWRCHPNLTFNKETLGLDKNASQKDGASGDLIVIVDRILEKRLGNGVKTFKLAFYDRVVDPCRLNNWLQTAGALRVEELSLSLPSNYHYQEDPYNFPCSILVDECGNSMIRNLFIGFCTFRPASGLANLTTLHLHMVHITGDELGSLVSNSSALERLTLRFCNDITYLKIPALLQRLSHLMVLECRKLQMVESKAPNLSAFHFNGAQVQLSFGDAVRVKNISTWCFVQCNTGTQIIQLSFGEDAVQVKNISRRCSVLWNTVYNARVNLPSIVPNVEILSIYSISEVVNTPILPTKFLHLKCLSICLGVRNGSFSPTYDYLSLVSFLDACPVLETFQLTVSQTRIKHDSDFGESSRLRQMPEYRHDNIKNVKIIGFCSAKSMVELACHILENATSLECLTLEICNDNGYIGRHIHKIGERITPHRLHMIKEARKALLAVERYIVGKVPSRVKFNVLEPYTQCFQCRIIFCILDEPIS